MVLEGAGYTSEKVLAWFSSWEVLGFDSDDSNLDSCYEVLVAYPDGERPSVLSDDRIKSCDIEGIKAEAVVERIIREKILSVAK